MTSSTAAVRMRLPLKSKVALEEGLQITPKECEGSYLR